MSNWTTSTSMLSPSQAKQCTVSSLRSQPDEGECRAQNGFGPGSASVCKQSATEVRLLLFGFCCVILFAATRLILTFAHYSADPNEGWNAFHAMIAMTGGQLYPPANALTGSNYPPVSFYVVGWLGKILGDFIVAGRLLSVVSILGTAGLILVTVRQITRQSGTGLFAVLLFLLYSVTLFRSYFDLNDPQWFAHLFEIAGFTTLLMPNPTASPSTRRIVTAALLFALSGFIKQNLVGIPLAVTIWLAVIDRRALAMWLVSGVIFLGLGFAACYALYGGPFFQDVLLAPRAWSTARAATEALPILLAMTPMIVATLTLLKRASQDSRILLIVLAAILCLLTSLVERCGAGVDINAHFETLIVLSVGSGLALASALNRNQLLRWLFVPFIVLVPLAGAKAYGSIVIGNHSLAAWHRMEARIRSVRGPVACENLAYCYWAGKGYDVDFFLYDQKILVGKNTQALSNALRKHAIHAAAIRLPGAGRTNSHDPLSALLYADRDRVLHRQGNRVLISLR